MTKPEPAGLIEELRGAVAFYELGSKFDDYLSDLADALQAATSELAAKDAEIARLEKFGALMTRREEQRDARIEALEGGHRAIVERAMLQPPGLPNSYQRGVENGWKHAALVSRPLLLAQTKEQG